jgi:hypothetical protein
MSDNDPLAEILGETPEQLSRRAPAMTVPDRIAMAVPMTPLTPMAMIGQALASGAGVETLERLMALQERWEANEAKREFDAAISAIRAKIKPVVTNRKADFKTKGGDAVDYEFADFGAIADAIDPILSEHGLSYRHRAAQDGVGVSVTCIISHCRGHREETTLSAGYAATSLQSPIQAMASALTQLQRHTLKLGLGLAVARDNDSNDMGAPKTIDDAQFRYLQDLIDKAEASEAKLLAYLKADKLETLTQTQYKNAEIALRKRINAAAHKGTADAS